MEFYGHQLARRGRPKDWNRLVTLENHVVAEDVGDPHLRLRPSQEKQQVNPRQPSLFHAHNNADFS